MNRLSKVQVYLLGCKDSRISKLVELFGGIRLVKFQSWESQFESQVDKYRNPELKHLRSNNLLNAVSSFVWMFVPVVVALVTFSVYAALGFDLTPTVAFSSVALFNVLRFPLNMLPNVLSSIADIRVSLNRIQEFLDSPVVFKELVNSSVGLVAFKELANSSVGCGIQVKAGKFAFSDGIEALSNVSISVNQGSLCAIVGRVGSGKVSEKLVLFFFFFFSFKELFAGRSSWRVIIFDCQQYFDQRICCVCGPATMDSESFRQRKYFVR